MIAESITIKLPSGATIVLNDQQVEAHRRILDWLADKSGPLFFTLSGYAGTGKTTITKHVIQEWKTLNRYSSVAVSAPTHKARKVIKRATGESSHTVQSLLGLRPDTDLEDFDINKPTFDAKAEKLIQSYRFLVIDEASMLNADLFELIVAEAAKSKTKVLFMGDEAQLPPVKEGISRIFTHVPDKIQLTKVERQAGSNPLMGVYDLIRSDIASPSDLFQHVSATNEAGEGITFFDKINDFDEAVLPLFASQEYHADPDYIKLIAYTNESVKVWNKKIRDHLYNTPTVPVLVGDVLFAYNTVSLERDQPLIENSSDYVVREVRESKTSFGVDCYAVRLQSVDELTNSYVNIVRKTGLTKFLTEFHKLHDKAKAAPKGTYFRKNAWRIYYSFKAQHVLLSDIMQDGRKVVKKDIDYGYAITCHKSQGSTFTYVAVSENNLDLNGNNEERNKLKYVAFSRPTRRAIVFSNKTKQ